MCLFIVCETMCTIGESRAISHASYTEQQANKWLEILAGENLPPKVFWRFIGGRIEEDNREAERTSLSRAKATSSTQRPQTCKEAATRYYNYIVNETDGEREHRLPKLQLKSDRRSGRSANG